MHKTMNWLWLLTLLWVSNPSQSEPPQSKAFQTGHYVFAVIYENYGWAEQKKGLFITGDGLLNTYDISNMDLSSILYQERVTAQQMDNYFNVFPVFREILEPDTYLPLLNVLSDIRNGPYGQEYFTCVDAGSFFYLAFEYEPSDRTYRPIPIYQTGNVRQQNLHPQAEWLKNWLVDIAVKYQIVYELMPSENNWCSGM